MNYLIGVQKLFNFLTNEFIKELVVILHQFSRDVVSNIRLVSFIVLLKIYNNVKEDYILDFIKKSIDILKNDKDEEYTNNMTSGALATDKFIKIKTVTILLVSHFLFK